MTGRGQFQSLAHRRTGRLSVDTGQAVAHADQPFARSTGGRPRTGVGAPIGYARGCHRLLTTLRCRRSPGLVQL